MKYTRTILDPSEQIMMLHSKNNDGRVSHSHEFIELVYVSSGKGIHSVRGQSNYVSTGDLFIIGTNDEHSLHPIDDEKTPFEWTNCLFLPEFIPFDFSVFPPKNRYVCTEGFETHYIFQAMSREFFEKKPGYLDILRGFLHIVLVRLSRRLAEEEDSNNYTERKMQNYLKKALEYIYLNYHEKIDLRALTTHLSISPSYIGKIFKDLKGVSPVAYVNQYRLEQSCNLLLKTTLSIQEVAAESGFKDNKFYHSLFKRTMGMTPGEFRSKYQ